MNLKKVPVRLRVILAYCSWIAALVYFAGCASGKVKKLEDLSAGKNYREVIDSGIDCDAQTPECFRIKLIRAESYYRLGHRSEALTNLKEAIDRISPQINISEAFRAYAMRVSIVFEELNTIDDFEKRRMIVNKLLPEVEVVLEKSKQLPQETERLKNQRRITELLAEIILLKMDLTEADSLAPVSGEMDSVCSAFKQLLPDQGYDLYYRLAADYKLVLPGVKRFFLTGIGDREKLMLRLKDLYQQGLQLRNLSVYNQGYDGEIENFLKQTDYYMKQLAF